MSRTLGSLLHPSDQTWVLNDHPYRMTHESVARWPVCYANMLAGGWRMTLISDAQWLASTTFKVRKDRRLDQRETHCQHDAHKFRTVVEV